MINLCETREKFTFHASRIWVLYDVDFERIVEVEKMSLDFAHCYAKIPNESAFVKRGLSGNKNSSRFFG